MTPTTLPPPAYIRSFDSTRLAVWDIGPRNAPVLLLINGLGGNLVTWKFVIDRFRDRLRFISFDYRGMYDSERPTNGDFTMDAHARDAVSVLDHFKVDKALVMGWSMGVQVCFEVYRRIPGRVVGLILANGAYGTPLDKAPTVLKPAAMPVVSFLAVAADRLRPVARKLLSNTRPLKLAKKVGLVSQQLDEDVFLDLVQRYIELDFSAYRDCTASLINHSAEDILEHVKVPTLILGGGRDFFTPKVFSDEMARRIPDAELHVIEDASHYCAVEYPQQLVGIMEKWLERVLAPTPKRKRR
ncbi:MAG: alpha/beta hydrolase [Deltaproteobacteria bacterium]|nr:alpha/beta hydrolase [Deltaproteobacteria bacterium]